MNPMPRLLKATLAIATLLLVSCGGGGGSGGTCLGSYEVCNGIASYEPQVLPAEVPSSTVAGICEATAEKQFIRSYLNESYLWYDEIPSSDAARYTTPGYFYSLLVETPDSTGQPRDRFSAIISLADADTSATGAGINYGVVWARDTQGRTRVALVSPGSPAALANMARGGELVSILSNTHNSWEPNAAGASITFNYRDAPGQTVRQITLTSAAVREDPVPMATTVLSPNGRRVGYVLFNSHSIGAQDKLIDALRAMSTGGIQDLVLDMRYNSGGFLYIAAALGSMVTGPGNDNKVFERLQFNRKRAAESAAAVVRVRGTVEFEELLYPEGTPLPRLGLSRVYVLSSGDTCSASEAVINGLRGVDVEVIVVGQTTCGKPYGFSRQDNCGYALFPIEFQGFNAKDFGDYAGGFRATCAASDDLDRPLGTTSEAQLAVALRHVDQGSCAAPTASARPAAASSPAVSGPPLRRLPPARWLTPAKP